MNKTKKVPLRKCVATNEQYPKKEMFRIVRTPEGNIIIDEVGKANGRGAYLSKSLEAIKQARKKKILDKHLETVVPEEIYEILLEKLGGKGDK
ncbi:MAG: YlxR family protein [Bacilli bacterium]|jgi:hypothetical protein|nr:YlxR family protein [Bacilli bacterium]MDD4056173.1 YlxR family protein [Bacilli bacterium]MDY0208681.1 YlxR family protein [Bacilli bacterium]